MVDNRNIRCLPTGVVSHNVLTCATFAKSGHTTPRYNSIMRRSVLRPFLVSYSLVASNGTGTLFFWRFMQSHSLPIGAPSGDTTVRESLIYAY